MPVVNSSYTVIVNNGKVIQIADNSIDFEMRNINTNFNMNDATIAKEAATSDTVRQNIYTCIGTGLCMRGRPSGCGSRSIDDARTTS